MGFYGSTGLVNITSRTASNLFALMLFTLMLLAQPSFAKDEPRTLHFLNWADYIDPEIVAEFEAQYNVTVKETFFESDEARDDIILQTGGKGYDLLMIDRSRIPYYVKQGWLSKITSGQVPNLKHINPRWLNTSPGAEGYAVPYFWGTIGIAYRSDLVTV